MVLGMVSAKERDRVLQRAKRYRLEGTHYRNPNLRLATKARGCKVTGQERNPGAMSHAPRSARECEGINPQTLEGTLTLGVGVPMDSQIFTRQLQGLKLSGLKSYLYHWKAIGT